MHATPTHFTSVTWSTAGQLAIYFTLTAIKINVEALPQHIIMGGCVVWSESVMNTVLFCAEELDRSGKF